MEKLTPIIKWAGGKEKELKHILPNLPSTINRYFEPFVGGGAVHFALGHHNSYINDKSIELIDFYNNVKEKNEQFFSMLTQMHACWVHLQQIAIENKDFFTHKYKMFSIDEISSEKYDLEITKFLRANRRRFEDIVSKINSKHKDYFIKELHKNLSSKSNRMKKIELNKGPLPIEDIADNFESAMKSAFYMYIRFLYNERDELEIPKEIASSFFYFIRDHCYASMFRYNKSGKFNVPYGGISYNRKNFIKKINYLRNRYLIKHMQSTTIYNYDFESFITKTNPSRGDFIFLDPPYDSDFSSYAGNDFTHEDQERLANYLYKTKANFMLVIKNTEFIYKLYNQSSFNIKSFNKKYLVSFQNRNNKHAEHLMITNY